MGGLLLRSAKFVRYLFNNLPHEDGWDSINGRVPNMRGTDAEGVARTRLAAQGYTFEGRQVTASDGTQVRFMTC